MVLNQFIEDCYKYQKRFCGGAGF